jgi:hypothetical protein
VRFNPVFPIVHAPSFRPSSENAILLLSVCSVGALFMGSATAAAQGRKIFQTLNKANLSSVGSLFVYSCFQALLTEVTTKTKYVVGYLHSARRERMAFSRSGIDYRANFWNAFGSTRQRLHDGEFPWHSYCLGPPGRLF